MTMSVRLTRKAGAKTPGQPVSRVRWEAMEPRLLLSADTLAGAGLDAGSAALQTGPELRFDDAGAISAAIQSLSASEPFTDDVGIHGPDSIDLEVFARDDQDTDSTPATALFPLEVDQRTELLIVDTRVEDYQQFIDGVIGDTGEVRYEILILDPGQSGIEQISAQLSQRSDIDALHIISHGREGQLLLGSEWLTTENLASHSADLAQWRSTLTENADVLLYGCNLAGDAQGMAFIQALSDYTGADVAASDDLTGANTLGGDWQLEYTIGDIDSTVAVSTATQQTWSNVLATFTVTTTSDVINAVDGLTSLREAIIDANALAGADEIVLGPGTYSLSLGSAGEDSSTLR